MIIQLANLSSLLALVLVWECTALNFFELVFMPKTLLILSASSVKVHLILDLYHCPQNH